MKIDVLNRPCSNAFHPTKLIDAFHWPYELNSHELFCLKRKRVIDVSQRPYELISQKIMLFKKEKSY